MYNEQTAIRRSNSSFNRILRISAFLGLWLSAIGSNAQSQKYFMSGGRRIDVDRFNEKLRKAMQDLDVPAVSLAVIDKNQVVFSEGIGYKQKNGAKADNETIFEACSLSKSFLVYIAYKLVDEGKLDLDKPMHEYLNFELLSGDPRYRLITARMVLSHSSGIENWRDMNNPDSLEITAYPGTQYVYSGEGYHYLAHVIEKLLKEDYAVSVKRMILNPLKLTRTFTSYKEDGLFPRNYAIGHDLTGKPIPKWKNIETVPASGIHTTAGNYAKLITSFFEPGNFSDQSLRAILRPAVRIIESEPVSWYGPGFEIIYSGGDTLICHGGANGGFRNIVFYSVKKRNGFVLMTNQEWGKKLATFIAKELTSLDISPRVMQDDMDDQYPDNTTLLLKQYKQKGLKVFLQSLEQYLRSGKIGPKTLSELGYRFFYEGREDLTRSFFTRNIALFPRHTWAYLDYGYYYLDKKQFDSAYKYFNEIRQFGGDTGMMIYPLHYCEEKLGITSAYIKNAVLDCWAKSSGSLYISREQLEAWFFKNGINR